MALGVVRMKRKAYEEPAEALVIALKKSKCHDDECEIHLKFATTIPTEANFLSGHIQAAITQDKMEKDYLRQSPKHIPISSSSKRVQYFRAEQKIRRQQAVAGRRLIVTHSLNQECDAENLNSSELLEEESASKNCFVLYDIIEENEDPKINLGDVKKDILGNSPTITCNGQPLQRVFSDTKVGDYVYDVYYVTKGNLDDQFIEGSLSIEQCDPVVELVEEEEDGDGYYDEEDDSNDEDNWRNDYPDEDSDFEKERDFYGDYDYDEDYLMEFQKFNIDEDKEGSAYARYKAKILSEINDDDEETCDKE